MGRFKFNFVQCLLLLLLVACSRSPTNLDQGGEASSLARRIASVDVVKVSTQPVEIVAGTPAETVVHLTIQSGYHVNANPPTYPYLKATELEIVNAEGVSVAFITYPNPISKKFSFADKPLDVYEGDTALKALLKADQSAKKGQRSLAAKLRVQACDDQVCYPPGTLDLELPITVK